jgi:photosystem II stability/assembly factor-like uncharacterized protein
MKKLLFILLFTISLFHNSLHSQWVKQTIPVNKNVTGIKFIDSLRGWACTNISTLGDTSYIIHTTNGGTNWYIQFIAPDVFFNSLFAINSNIVYVGGYNGGNNTFMLLKTTNGGINWTNMNPPSVPSDMFFVNQDSGWYCDDFIGPDVRTTTDGGQTWTLRISGLTDNINRLFFLNYSTGWAGSRYFKKTTNAGLSWVQIYDFAVEEIHSMYFLNEQTGWAGLDNEKIRFTSNGGTNWTLYTFPPLFGNLFDIAYFNNKIYFGNKTMRLLLTTNNGTEWVYQIDSSGSYRLSFVDSLKGWSGDFGIAKTTNGGGQIIYIGIININTNIPHTFKLYQNYPNPFNSQTNIRFSLTKRSYIQFKVFDILGREKTIWQSEQQLEAGTHQLQFDAKDFASGVYFYRLTIYDEQLTKEMHRETKKMILIK